MNPAQPALMTAWRPAQHRAALGAPAVAAALVCGAAAVPVVVSSDHYDDRMLWVVFLPRLGWSFVGTGVLAWSPSGDGTRVRAEIPCGS